jgi:hypothetical protein
MHCNQGPTTSKSPFRWLAPACALVLLALSAVPASANCLSCSDKWLPQIQNAAQQTGVDPKLIQAFLAYESSGNQYAKSGKNAYGLMQVLPGTFHDMGGKGDIYNPDQNILAGAKYIAQGLRVCNGNIAAALAGYNMGNGGIKANGCRVPPSEMGYVQGVLGNYQKLGGKYDGTIPPAPSIGAPGSQGGDIKVPSANDITGLSLELSNFFEELFNQLMQLDKKISGNLAGEGARLASVLTIIAVIWTGLHAALKQDPLNKLIARMVEVLMICAIALMLVQSSFYDQYIHQPIDNTFCAVAGRFSNVQGSTDCKAMNGSVKRMTAGITEGVMNIWNSIIVEAHEINPLRGDSFLDKAGNLIASAFQISKTLTLMTLWLLDALVKIIIIVILLAAMLTCFIVYTMSVILSSIGFALGPVFIPWMILEVSSKYTENWARFVLIAELYKVMAVLIMSIGNPLIDRIMGYVCKAGGTGAATTCQAGSTVPIDPSQPWAFGQLILETDIPLLIVAVLLAHFMKHAGHWAEGIVNGGARTGLRVTPWF